MQNELQIETMRQLLNKPLIGATSAKAKVSPRLRMNHNFHPSLYDKVQRFINCMAPVDSTSSPTAKVEIHHHPVDEKLTSKSLL